MRQTRERMVCDGNISPSPRPRERRHQDGTETSKEGKENNRARSKSKFDIFLSFLICFLSCYHVKFLIPSGFSVFYFVGMMEIVNLFYHMKDLYSQLQSVGREVLLCEFAVRKSIHLGGKHCF